MIKKNALILSVILFFTIFNCKAYDCSKLSKNEIYEDSDGVYLGYVFEVADTTFKVRVLEIFKGNYPDTLIGTFNENTIIPDSGSTWLIYSNDLEDGTFIIHPCSGSKSFQFPYGYHDLAFPIPPPPEIYDSPAVQVVLEQVLKGISLNEMYFEISNLRRKKSEENIKELMLRNIHFGDKLERISQNYNLLMWLLVGVIILQVFYMIGWFRRAK